MKKLIILFISIVSINSVYAQEVVQEKDDDCPVSVAVVFWEIRNYNFERVKFILEKYPHLIHRRNSCNETLLEYAQTIVQRREGYGNVESKKIRDYLEEKLAEEGSISDVKKIFKK